jgi:DNA adenine methylase
MLMIDPFLKWAGGKRWFVASFSKIFPKEYNRYVEPFLGSGAVFFSLNPKKAILADTNGELIDTYKALKADWQSVYELLKVHQKHHAKDYYYKIRSSKPELRSARAARFIYLNRTCWNGLYRVNLKGQFNVPIGTKNKVIMETDNFQKIAQRLKNAQLCKSDFGHIIDATIRNDFLFVDPPYTINHSDNGFIKYNEKLFSWNDQIRLCKCLLKAKQRGVHIVLTNAPHESIYDLYSGSFKCSSVRRSSVIAADPSNRKKCEELIITSNFIT